MKERDNKTLAYDDTPKPRSALSHSQSIFVRLPSPPCSPAASKVRFPEDSKGTSGTGTDCSTEIK